jgi:hypothetical protein
MREHREGQPAAAIIQNKPRQEKTTGLPDPVEVDSNFARRSRRFARSQTREGTWRFSSQAAQATSAA